ncbi:MAG: 1-acyl-sn-glycerol-3-phosphate acyltransferase [Treponema sp.]|nr:1-acyl-sn-glycerol-3-phosphate acyltransferase [Treponema sp.]
MIILRTFLAFCVTLFSVLAFIPIGISAFLLSFLGLRRPMSWVTYRLAQTWARAMIFASGCPMDVQGRDQIPMEGGLCFISNHVGYFDIILALAYAGRPFGFVAKKELLYLPFFNIWISLLGGLFIDRKNVRKAIKTINRGIKKIQDGGAMLIFPEGTRSKGQGLLPFRSGAIKLATNSLAAIVPVAITGSYEVLERTGRIRPVPLRVVFCPPIITKDMNGEDRRHKLTDQVRLDIEKALGGTPELVR